MQSDSQDRVHDLMDKLAESVDAAKEARARKAETDSGPSEDPPDTPALNAWYETHPGRRSGESTRVRLWFPHVAPHVTVHTIDRGCQQSPVLEDPAKPTVDVHLGSTISIGGYLHEIEAYFAAVTDALRVARWQADTLAAQQAQEDTVREATSG